MAHLYEIVISNPRMWLKVQASCSSSEQSAALFESRFTGTDYIVDGHQPVTPFRLSERSHFMANWASIVDGLPEGWDDDEFHIAGTPYPWCDTLADDCDCHGAKGRLDITCCSAFGLDETDRRASKSRERLAPALYQHDGRDYCSPRRVSKRAEAPTRATFAVPARGPRRGEGC